MGLRLVWLVKRVKQRLRLKNAKICRFQSEKRNQPLFQQDNDTKIKIKTQENALKN